MKALPLVVSARCAAALLGCSVRTLRRWTSRGDGPRCIRVGSRAVRYVLRDVVAMVAPPTYGSSSPSADPDAESELLTGREAAARIRALLRERSHR